MGEERQQMHEQGSTALDWQSVYTWAQQKPVGTILGQSCTNSDDPLGAYLGEKTGTPSYYWSIGPSIKNGYEDRIPKPEWVTQLIKETDGATGNQSGPVTREMYLDILERVQPSWVTEIDQHEHRFM